MAVWFFLIICNGEGLAGFKDIIIRYVEQADYLFNRFEWEQTVIYETIN